MSYQLLWKSQMHWLIKMTVSTGNTYYQDFKPSFLPYPLHHMLIPSKNCQSLFHLTFPCSLFQFVLIPLKFHIYLPLVRILFASLAFNWFTLWQLRIFFLFSFYCLVDYSGYCSAATSGSALMGASGCSWIQHHMVESKTWVFDKLNLHSTYWAYLVSEFSLEYRVFVNFTLIKDDTQWFKPEFLYCFPFALKK